MFRTAEGDRSGVPNYLVIITDGKSDDPQATWDEAIRARDEGINILAVGVGQVGSSYIKTGQSEEHGFPLVLKYC